MFFCTTYTAFADHQNCELSLRSRESSRVMYSYTRIIADFFDVSLFLYDSLRCPSTKLFSLSRTCINRRKKTSAERWIIDAFPATRLDSSQGGKRESRKQVTG